VRINNPPKKKRHRGLLAAAVILALIAALFLDSRFRLVTTEYTLSCSGLPQSFDGYRVVQLSDLHMAQFGKDNARLLRLTAEQTPDIIVMTGDFLDDRTPGLDQTDRLKPFLEKLTKIAPCYFVSGNHEWASGELDKLASLMRELGITYLRNGCTLLKRGNDSLVLEGVEDPNGPRDMVKPDELAGAAAQKYPGKFRILLAHRNDMLKKYPDLPVNLVLCGHSHGGVVRLPFLGGVFGTEHDLFPKYDAGLFNEGTYDMIVSRGLGWEAPMYRFLNNPELVTVVLKKN